MVNPASVSPVLVAFFFLLSGAGGFRVQAERSAPFAGDLYSGTRQIREPGEEPWRSAAMVLPEQNGT
tara:strand:- start:600 stop:800 length:201 start_codon:yes stop_codon:yes gene_type:complete